MEELEIIENECIRLHYSYGLGIALSPKIHDLFHSVYSRYNNTPEQFKEFQQRYLSGEFKE